MASSGNFCVWSAVTKNAYGTLSKGNLEIKGNSNSGGQRALSSFGLRSGKWYMEFRITEAGNNYPRIGLSLGSVFDSPNFSGDGYQAAFLYEAGTENNGSNCKNANDSTGRAEFGTVTYTNTGVTGANSNQIIGFALDLDNRKLFISKDGTFFNSANPATGTNPQIAWDATPSQHIHLWGDAYQTATVLMTNWGQDSTFNGTETATTNADENGHGTFHSTVPTGYLAMCTANLPISANIDPAETDDDIPTKLFGAEKFTGNGGTQTIQLGDGFQPDCVWLKNRGTANSWVALDSSRGYNKTLKLETADAESTNAYVGYGIESDFFASTGIKANGGGSPGFNNNTHNYIVYGWRANGGTTSTNSDGTTTSTVQANQAGGFSIITYAGNGSNRTIGHGLSAAPEFMIVKDRDGTNNWVVYSKDLGAAKRANLNNNIAWGSSSTSFQSTDPSATVITLGTSSGVNNSTRNYVCYAWHSVDGFSKFGAFEGNSNADGPVVYTGFRPRFVVLKGADATENWQLRDTARHSNTGSVTRLYFNSNAAEGTASTASPIDFLANGFKVRGSNSEVNTNTIFFAAWADVPFKYNNTHSESY